MQSVASRPSVGFAHPLSRSSAANTHRSRAIVAGPRASASSDRGSAGSNVVADGIEVSLGRRLRQAAMSVAAGAVIAAAPPAMARLEGVNNPQMLPPGEPQEVLDVAGERFVHLLRPTPDAQETKLKIIEPRNVRG